jgi:hypothetical protein
MTWQSETVRMLRAQEQHWSQDQSMGQSKSRDERADVELTQIHCLPCTDLI